ncbi:MAG: PAS domain S-box protein [Tenuifilaceae bacterium]
MRSKAIIKENYSRRRIILSVIIIIAILSSFYSYQSIRNNQKFKDQLVEISIKEFQQDVDHLYQNTSERLYDIIKIISQNPLFKKSIDTKDSTLFYETFSPLVGIHEIGTISNLYFQSGDGLTKFGKKRNRQRELVFKPVDSSYILNNDNHIVSIDNDGVSHVIHLKIDSTNLGFAELSVNGIEGIKFLEDKTGVQVFTVFTSDLFNNISKENQNIVPLSNDQTVLTFGKSDFLEKIITKHGGDFFNQEKKQTIKIDNKYYQLVKTGDFFLSSGEVVGSANAVVDITILENSFRSSMLRSIFITLLIIVFSFITIFLFFDRIIEMIFRINEGFEKEVALRTKEILDTNTELQQIFNSTANGMRIINKNYEIIRVNDAFCRISGTTKENIEGNKCYDVFPGIFCHTTNCPLNRINEGETTIETEEIRFKKGGKKIQCQHTSVPFLGKEGEFLGIIEDFKDITERLDVENTLKRTEEQFSAFMDSMPVGIFIKDNNGVLLYQNTYLNSVFGFDNLIGKDLRKELDPEWANRISKEDDKALQLGKIEFEEAVTDKEGRERTFVTHKFRFMGVDNNWRIGGVSIDVTNKKNAEHYLYVLSKAIKNSPISVVITNPSGEIEFINQSFTQLTGYSQTEALHKNLLDIKVEYNSGNNLYKAFESVQKGGIWKGEVHLQSKKGDHYWVIGSFTPIYNKKGEVAHAVVSMEDITLRKENERELFLSKTRAEESDKLKTAFLSNLSHEIRTPLNAIIGFSSLLTDSDLSKTEKKNLSDVVYKNSNDLLKLIENLIEISEIETGQLTIKKTECNVNKLMLELQETFLEEDKKGKAVKLNLRREIRADDFTILTDAVRLKQVLNNLISNACKFTEMGFIEFGYAFNDERNLVFYVIDTGVGIEPEKQKYIFNPFRQADDSNTRRFSGMGLGLAISKHIVEKLGGRIWLTSAPGSGSTFYFTIPYIPVRFKFDPEPKEEKKSTYNWKNKTILVADDIDANYIYLKAAIKPTNAEIIWAKNGFEAIEHVKNNPDISLVLMDIVMPDMDGFEATRQIKMHNSNIPVVCQTAYPSSENYQLGVACGFDSFMAKPIKVDGMLQTIDKFFIKN